jgi:hypothetical protein
MPVDPHTQSLIDADVSGELASTRRGELGRILMADPEARALHTALKKTESLLRDIPSEEPPEGMREAILARVHAGAGGGATGTATGRPLRRAWAMRYAAVFVAGVFVASGVFYLAGPGGPGDSADLAGTMAGPWVGSQLVDQASIRADGAEGELRLSRTDRLLVLELELTSPVGVEFELSYVPSALGLTGVGSLDVAAGELEAAPGTLSIASPPGRHVHRVYFKQAGGTPASVDVALRSSGRTIARQSVTAPAGD